MRYGRNLLGEDSEDPSAERSMLIDSRFLRLATLCRLKLPLLLLRPAPPMLPPALVAAPSAYWSALPALPWSLLAWPVVSACRAGSHSKTTADAPCNLHMSDSRDLQTADPTEAPLQQVVQYCPPHDNPATARHSLEPNQKQLPCPPSAGLLFSLLMAWPPCAPGFRLAPWSPAGGGATPASSWMILQLS